MTALTVTGGEDRQVSESEVAAIVRCTAKGCRRAHRAAFVTVYTVWAYEGRMATSHSVIWAGRECRYRDRYDLAGIIVRDFTCAGCGGHGATFEIIRGTFAEAVKCGPRCRNAVGPSCDCQCGGENHATGHTAIG